MVLRMALWSQDLDFEVVLLDRLVELLIQPLTRRETSNEDDMLDGRRQSPPMPVMSCYSKTNRYSVR